MCVQVSNRNSGTVIPPPLVRGGTQVSKHGSTVVMPPLVRGSQVCIAFLSHVIKDIVLISIIDVCYKYCRWHYRQVCFFVLQPIAVTPQQIATLRQQQQQHSGSGPPPLLLGPRTSVPNVQVQGQRIIQQGLIRVTSVANANVLVPQVNSVIQFKQFLLILLIKWS